jgi:hypothetical protein
MRAKNNNEKPLESYLWHGTSKCDPKLIWESSDGFTINFSNDGMWGRGLYFAQNASYSNNYSYNH